MYGRDVMMMLVRDTRHETEVVEVLEGCTLPRRYGLNLLMLIGRLDGMLAGDIGACGRGYSTTVVDECRRSLETTQIPSVHGIRGQHAPRFGILHSASRMELALAQSR